MSTMAKKDPILTEDQSAFFRQIVDSSPALIHTARPDGHLDFFNRAWLNFIGQPLEKLLGWQWTSFIHPEDVEAFVQKWRESIATGEGFEGTARVRRADGEYRWMLHQKLAMRGDRGEIIKWHGSSVDIDGQKRAEDQLLKSTQELQRSEAYLAEAQRLSHTGNFGWKPGSEQHVWSDETYRIFEYSPGEKVTLDMIVERVHPEDRNFVLETVERASISGGGIDYEYRLLFPDNRVKNVHVLARRLETNSDDIEYAGVVIDITEAKQAEEKLRLSEKELQTLVEAIPAYVGTNLPDGSLDFISQSWLDYTGLSREQWMGWGWVSTMHPDDVDRVVANWQAALAKGEPAEYQLRCRGMDGIYHWFLYRGVPFCDEGGNIVKWYGTVTNIDVLKETESALQTREQQLLGIIDTIPSLLWSASPALVPTHLSKRLLEYFGAPFEEFVNGGWESFIHPDDREETAKALLRAVDAGESFSVVHRLRRGDGEYRWHHAKGEPLRDPEGKIIQWYGLSVDIDDRKRAEETLRNSERELRQILDLLPQQIRVYGPGGERLYANQIALHYYGVSLEEWRQTSEHAFRSSLLVHPDDQERAARDFDANSTSGSAYESEMRVRGADGNYRWFLVRHNALHDEQRQVMRWYVGLTDIEDRKQAEEKLRRSQFYLAEGERLGQTGSWAFNPSGVFEYWSQGLFQIYGLDPQNGAPTLEQYLATIHPQDRDFMAETVRRMCEQSSGCDVKKRIIRSDGAARYVRCVGIPVLDNGVLKRFLGTAMDVTEQEQLTQELQRREAYLAEAQRLSHTGSFGWNPDTGDIVWSDETYRIFEYDGARKPTLDMLVERLHPQDRAFFQQFVDSASQAATHFEHEYRLLLADGRVKHVHAIAHALQDALGNREFIGAVTDITERKTAEEKILCNERELRTLIDVMPAYVGTALPDGTADFFSQRWLDYFGQTREEAMGWGWAHVIHPDDVDRVLANWQAGLISGEPVEQELRCRRADGVYHWFLNRNLPLRDDEGKILKWYGILFDIDVLKKTESALQMREQELLGIIETIPSMLWSASPTGQTTHLSQRCLEYCGASLEELVNRGWERYIHQDDLLETVKAFSRAMSTGESYRAIHRLRRADGEYRWHHAMGEPLRDPHGEIIQWYGLTIDIDERKRAEDHLRDTRDKLAKASRLATVAELAASIAHELNQPLMSILANAQAAKRWLNGPQSNMTEVNSSIERTIRDARAADETMQHIRALFKQESFVKKDVKIPAILNEVVRIVQEDLKKRAVPVECHFDESLPAVSVDQIQVQQVLINLIVNALEALEGQHVAPLVILRAAVTDSDRMLIQVIDNGPGVDDPERIFDAFMTTKAKGMGIGLAVSRSIIEAHGGRLWAENNETGGAIFNVALPLTRADSVTRQVGECA